MFVKRAVKPSLEENYEESSKVEAELYNINKHTVELEVKTFSGKKPLLLTILKEENSNELENVVKMVKKLSNKIVDLEKDKAASSSKKLFKPFSKKIEESGTYQPSVYNSFVLNFNEVGMDHFCTFHQEPQYEKSFPQWINSMTLVMSQILDAQITEPEVEEEKKNEPKESHKTMMVLWDGAPTLWLDEEEPIE